MIRLTALLLLLATPAFGQLERVADLYPGSDGDRPNSGSPQGFVVLDDVLYFSADGASGNELYAYNAATQTARLAAEIEPDVSSSGDALPSFPDGLTPFNGALYFAATSRPFGRELFAYDPAADTVGLAAEINTRGGSGVEDLVVYDGHLYFMASNAPGVSTSAGRELYRYDPATGQAEMVDDFSPGLESSDEMGNFAVYDGRLFTSHRDEAGASVGNELYAYDSQTDELSLVADIDERTTGSNDVPIGSDPFGLTVFDDRLFFTARSADGEELWVYDAATDQTTQVADLYPGNAGSRPTGLTELGGRLYFSAVNPLGDGTGVYALDPNGDNLTAVDPNGSAFQLTVFDGALYYLRENFTLVRYDANADEVTELATLQRSPTFLVPSGLTAYAGGLYFAYDGNDEAGYELWRYLLQGSVSATQAQTTAPRHLSSPAPNPTAGRATLTLRTSTSETVRVTLHDALGRQVRRLHEGAAPPILDITVDTAGLPAGPYFVRAVGETFSETAGLTVAF